MTIDEIARRYEPATARALLALWERLAGRLPVGQIADAMRQGPDAVLQLLSSATAPAAEMEAAVRPLVEAMRQAGRTTAAGFRLQFGLPDEQAAAMVMRTADEMGWLRYNIDPEGRELIRDTIRRAFMEGGHPYETARAIQGSIGLNAQQQASLYRFGEGLAQQGVSGPAFERAMRRREQQLLRQRAETIARTETIRAAREGQQAAWDQAVGEGVIDPARTWKKWIAGADPCPLCQEHVNMQAIPYSDEWPNGEYPHPRCRCRVVLLYDLEEGDPRMGRPQG